MTKSPDAFRTISEVAEWLDRPAHVLRFWESKFTQVKPIKRAGGRRYYRPEDMQLLGGIKKLLHDDGMTIKGVQKMLREQGVQSVTGLSQPLDVMAEPDQMVPSPEKVAELKDAVEIPESATLLRFKRPEEEDEAELSEASFEVAPDELTPEELAEEVGETPPPAPIEDTPEAQPEAVDPSSEFEAPSFFNMLDTTEPEADAQEPASETPEVVEESAEPELAPAPTPKIIEVSVDARSTKGPGVLTRLWTTAPESDHAALSELREKLRALSNRMQTG
ncbi:MAG: MerR family transcriptional regulator [Thalassovita sp.]